MPQPPSGGCELKRLNGAALIGIGDQPPSGGCELKHDGMTVNEAELVQPPSGGCELKLYTSAFLQAPAPARQFAIATHYRRCRLRSAAFGRLRVETRLSVLPTS